MAGDVWVTSSFCVASLTPFKLTWTCLLLCIFGWPGLFRLALEVRIALKDSGVPVPCHAVPPSLLARRRQLPVCPGLRSAAAGRADCRRLSWPCRTPAPCVQRSTSHIDWAWTRWRSRCCSSSWPLRRPRMRSSWRRACGGERVTLSISPLLPRRMWRQLGCVCWQQLAAPAWTACARPQIETPFHATPLT